MFERHGSKWLWALVAIPPVTAIVTNLAAPEPKGHWTEHLTGVGLKSAQLILLLVLTTLFGWRKLGPLLLLTFVAVAIGIGLQIVGDYQVADSIWRTSGNPGFGPGYVEGHDRSGLGDLFVMFGGLAFAVLAGAMRTVPVWLALLAAVMIVIPPPYFWPAAGVLVVLLHGITTKGSPPRPRRRRVVPGLPTEG